MYDYLIVVAGLFGSVCAYELGKAGKRCLVIDRRHHIGGNVYTEKLEGIDVHRYGAHIFHTKNKAIWDYICQFSEMNHYRHTVLANYRGQIYSLPFTMNTFNRMWGVVTPKEAEEKIRSQQLAGEIKSLEDQAISLVGAEIYEKLINGYTQKQWRRPCSELSASIIKRLPIRYTYYADYFDDPYQGIPVEGYTMIIEKMLEKAEVKLSTEYNEEFKNMAGRIIYTGQIDEFYNYRFGALLYRSLRFETEAQDTDNYQGVAVMNFTDAEIPYTG